MTENWKGTLGKPPVEYKSTDTGHLKFIAPILAAAPPTTAREQVLRKALIGLSGDYNGRRCWCDMRIGHPNCREHSAACGAAWEALQL